jgi:hypothetical protein
MKKKILKFVFIPAIALSFSSCWTYKSTFEDKTIYTLELPNKTIFTAKKDGQVVSRSIDDGTRIYPDTAYWAHRARKENNLR